jgi:thiamine-phosphate pyrophosphorylase
MVSPDAMSRQRQRVIDANLNRAGEGLHLLEDLARLMLNDAALTQQLKTIRHEVLRGDLAFNQQLIQSRDPAGDVGADVEGLAEEKHRELPIMVVANSRRVQEALRTLEELAKIPGIAPKLEGGRFKKARFSLYALERRLLSKVSRQDKTQHLSGLYAIIDSQALGGRKHLDVAERLIKGGAKAIQLRDKLTSKDELLSLAQQLKKLCSEKGVLFIVNDYLDIALASGADGLHLGQEDLPLLIARRLLPIDAILGGSVTTVSQAKAAESSGADYIAVGSIYPTASKEKPKVVGLERLRQVRQAVSLPLVAIGGINQDNAAEVAAAGADSIAVISAVLGAGDTEKAARKITTRFEASK